MTASWETGTPVPETAGRDERPGRPIEARRFRAGHGAYAVARRLPDEADQSGFADTKTTMVAAGRRALPSLRHGHGLVEAVTAPGPTPLPTRLRRTAQLLHDTVRSRLWPIPAFGVAVAVALGFLIPHLDARVDANLPGWLDVVAFGGDADAARTVLDAVASSLITVTSLTFSLTVVTLQLASSQFSPRLLRTFTQDLFVQVTLAIFLATFTFSLTVLRSVRSPAESAEPFVPRLAVTSSYLLAVASVMGLVLFLAHLARQIRVETMLDKAHRDASALLADTLGSDDQQASVAPVPPPDAETLWAWTSGFLLRVNHDALLEATDESDLVVRLDRHVGSFVVQGTPIGRVWATTGHPVSTTTLQDLQETLAGAVHLGPERTSTQDLGYGLRQLSDVAIKALSPGINDPTTAVHALGHTAALLAELSRYELGPLVLHNKDGEVRVMISRPSFAEFLDLALTQARRYGEADGEVLGRLYSLLADVAWNARVEYHQPIRHQLQRLHLTVAAQDFDEEQRKQLDGWARAVDLALSGRPRPRQGSPGRT